MSPDTTYDGRGNLTSLTDQNNNSTSWNYDVYGRVTNEIDATGTSILAYKYDADDHLTNRWSLARGTTGYGYDAAGNLTNVAYPLSSSLSDSYNAANWMTQMNDGFGATTFTYSPTGRLESENGPLANDMISYSYANGQRFGSQFGPAIRFRMDRNIRIRRGSTVEFSDVARGGVFILLQFWGGGLGVFFCSSREVLTAQRRLCH